MAELTAAEVTLLVADTLEAMGIPYLIGGSFASITHGVLRTTMDADLVVELQAGQVGPFVHALQEKFYMDALSILDAIQYRSSFNLIYLNTMFKIDIFLPKQRLFDQVQFERRGMKVIATEPDRMAWVASAEDTILTKLERFRMGDEVSERQWRDILGVLKTQGERLDRVYLRHWAGQLNVADLLARAFVETNL